MSFLLLILVTSLLSFGGSKFTAHPLDRRGAMRWGMALGFLYTGIDHFLSATTRYVPMIPDALADHALAWVYLTGVAELMGAVGLLVPVALYRRLGLPDLQRQAGLWLSVMLVCVVAANINVALKGETVEGLSFGAGYFWTRPLFQPVFVLWALYCTGWWPRRRDQRVFIPPR